MLSRCTLVGSATDWVRLNKAEIRMTESMSPRARTKLAAMRTAFRVAAIARSFDIGHLAFLFRTASQHRKVTGLTCIAGLLCH